MLEKIHNLAKCTLPLMDPSEENVELRNLWQLSNKIDKTAGTVMSLGEFRRTFEEIEKNGNLKHSNSIYKYDKFSIHI